MRISMYDVFNMWVLHCTQICLLTFFAIMESCQVLTPVNKELQRMAEAKCKEASFGGGHAVDARNPTLPGM